MLGPATFVPDVSLGYIEDKFGGDIELITNFQVYCNALFATRLICEEITSKSISIKPTGIKATGTKIENVSQELG